MRVSRRSCLAALIAAVALGGMVAPQPAHAWWRGGVGFGFAPFAPYPYRYPYYYPPPVVYAPPPYAVSPGGQSCYAGPYVCPLAVASPLGAPCSCPTEYNGRAGGRVG